MSLNLKLQFQFFENVPIRDPQLGTASQLYSDPTLSAAALINSKTLVIAVNSVTIKVNSIDNSSVLKQFNAFDDGYRITYLDIINNSYLVTVGEQTGLPAIFKVFKLDKLPKNGNSFLTKVELKNGDNTALISAISISPDLSCFTVGFTNGKIILVRGDLGRDRGAKQRMIYQDKDNEPITSLALDKDASCCFASTTSKIYLFATTGRNNGNPELILNNSSGINLNCGCMVKESNEFACFHDGNIEFYKTNGEKRSIAVDLKSIKRLFSISKDYILLVVEESNKESNLRIDDDNSSSMHRVIIIDVQNKVVALNFIMSNSVVDVLSSSDDSSEPIYLLASNGVIHRIIEKSIEDKLSIVIQKQLFQFALDIGSKQKISERKMQEIHKQFGDYLYKKGQKAEAVEQYIQCLDVVETSEVIAMFSIDGAADADVIKNLSEYIWSLIKKGKANEDHVTLLLIILIKLKDTEQVNDFLKHFTREGKYSENEITTDLDDEAYFYSNEELFDFKLILRLLDESNFKNEAYLFAKKFSKDAVTIVEVILDIVKDPWSALKYIKSLPIDDTLRALAIYSKDLLDLLPNDTNSLLITVFTGKYTPERYEYEKSRKEVERSVFDPKTIFYSYTSFMDYMNKSLSITQDSSKAKDNDQTPTYHPPKPSIVFTSFIGKPFLFVVFLEACLDSYRRYEGSMEDKQIILTTLYDIYLTLVHDDIPERQDSWKVKAKHILIESKKMLSSPNTDSSSSNSRSNNVDNSLMMLISHMNKVDMFLSYDEELDATSKDEETSIEYPLMKDESAYLINSFRCLTLTEDPNNSMRFFEKYCEKEPNLYRAALTYFVSSKHITNAIGGEEVLKSKIITPILKRRLLSMIDIVHVLSSSNAVTFGLIQDTLITHTEVLEQEIHKSQKLAESYESELKDKEEKIKSILQKTDGTTIQLKGKLCQMCETPLELPIVYFKCGHIYHQRCLNEEDYATQSAQVYKCPKCLVEFERAHKLQEAQLETSQKFDMFQMALDDAGDNGDKFKVITEFIGRGGLEFQHLNL
ncbi:tethering complex subunit [Maudiozyma humilis]|uniref:E3 ubiquitin-protein ligase PEP5 n=1 Tax=Maudiozyma humilis TaxID=51915 RepID=A0AAV5RZA7_MAUHU|nr:tethering complex subunit [Kazachstania humilis]